MTNGNAQLEKFFDEFFRLLPHADPSKYGAFFLRAETEFKRLGYREEILVDGGGVKNILIVRLDEIGDFVLTSGFIREVRRNFPNAHITLIVKPDVYSMAEFCPYVNEILTSDINSFQGSYPDLLKKIFDFCKENLWQRKFSIAFLPKWDGTRITGLLMAWFSGARERVGFGLTSRKDWLGEQSPEYVAQDNFFLTKNIITPRDAVITMAEKTFYLLENVGLTVEQNNLELWFSAEDFLTARELLKDIPPTCRKVLLGIGASIARKKYPVEKYLVALKELVKKNLVFVIVGGRSELEDANFIENNLPSGKVVNLVGKTTLRETEAVISQMNFYIGNNTGVMHMSAAAQVPCIALYCESQDREEYLPGILSDCAKFPPYQTKAVILQADHPLDDCATLPPCSGHCRHKEAHCITQIKPQEIIDAFEILETL